MTDKARKIFFIYLAVLSLAGGLIVFRATSKQGPGVSTDAAQMLSAGENLLKGRGLVNFRGEPLVQYPPLESALLALGSLLTGLEVFTFGWALCMIVFPFIIWFCGLYFYQAFHEEPLLAYFSSFIVFSSASLVQIASNIASDPLFLLIVVLFLMSMSGYLRSGRLRYWAAGIVLVILACFERYAALSLVITGAAITLYRHRSDLKKGIELAAEFALLSALPIFAWGYWHNLPINGLLFGHHQPAVPLLNLLTSIEKVLHWFIPLQFVSLIGPAWLVAIVVGALALLLLLTHTTGALRKLLSPEIAPSIAFLPVYAGVLLFSLSYSELKGVETDRVHLILLPSLLLVLFTSLSGLIRSARTKFGSVPFYSVAIVAFFIWSLYPLGRTFKYVNQSLVQGDVSAYNSMNSGDVRTGPLARYLLSMDPEQSRFYSNGSGKAWFILHTLVASPPLIDSPDRLTYLREHATGWPGAGAQAYLVWFNHESYIDTTATPQELRSIADLVVLYSDSDGTIYKVSPRCRCSGTP